jgi:spermidine synthase
MYSLVDSWRRASSMNRRKLCVLLGFWAVAIMCGKATPEEKTLYKKASPYATLVVTEDEDGLRTLRFGDDPAAQSIVKIGDPDQVECEYVKVMPVALTLVKEPKRVLIVGLGGGSLPSLLRKHDPRMTIDVVDIDPDVVEVAKRFFGFREDASMHVHVEDGRRFIEKCKQPYDIIFLDAYGPENIPYDLATKEFFLAVDRALKPSGVVASNVWSQSTNSLHDAMLRTYQEAFDDLYVIEVKNRENEIFLALPRKEAIDRADLARRASRFSKEKKLRFDVGEYVTHAFRHADKKDPGMRVLLDKDKDKEWEESSAASGCIRATALPMARTQRLVDHVAESNYDRWQAKAVAESAIRSVNSDVGGKWR